MNPTSWIPCPIFSYFRQINAWPSLPLTPALKYCSIPMRRRWRIVSICTKKSAGGENSQVWCEDSQKHNSYFGLSRTAHSVTDDQFNMWQEKWLTFIVYRYKCTLKWHLLQHSMIRATDLNRSYALWCPTRHRESGTFPRAAEGE